jgi:hypothetical protein
LGFGYRAITLRSMPSSAAKQPFRTLVTGANGFTGRYMAEKPSF